MPKFRMNIKFLVIALAKRVFQLHGVNFEEKVILRKRFSRKALIAFMAKNLILILDAP